MWVFREMGMENVVTLPDEYFLRLGKGVEEIAPHLLVETKTYKPPPPANILRCPSGRFLNMQKSRVRMDYPTSGTCQRYLWSHIGANKFALPDAFVASPIEPNKGFVRPQPHDHKAFDIGSAMTMEEFVESKMACGDTGLYQWFCPTIRVSYRRPPSVATLSKRSLRTCAEYVDTLVLGAVFEMRIEWGATRTGCTKRQKFIASMSKKFTVDADVSDMSPDWDETAWVRIPGEGFATRYRQEGGPMINTEKIYFRDLQDVCAYFDRWRLNRLSKTPKTWVLLWATTQPCRSSSNTRLPFVPSSLEAATCVLGHPVQQLWHPKPLPATLCRSCNQLTEATYQILCIYADNCPAYDKGDLCAQCAHSTISERKQVTRAYETFYESNQSISGSALDEKHSALAVTCQLICRPPKNIDDDSERARRFALQLNGEICSALVVPPERVVTGGMRPILVEGHSSPCTLCDFAILHPQIAKARLQAMIINQNRNAGGVERRMSDVQGVPVGEMTTFRATDALLKFSDSMKVDAPRADEVLKKRASKLQPMLRSQSSSPTKKSRKSLASLAMCEISAAPFKDGDEAQEQFAKSKSLWNRARAAAETRSNPAALAEDLRRALMQEANGPASAIRAQSTLFPYLSSSVRPLAVKVLFGFPDSDQAEVQSECRANLATDERSHEVCSIMDFSKDFAKRRHEAEEKSSFKNLDALGVVNLMRKFPIRHAVQIRCIERLAEFAEDDTGEGAKEIRMHGGLTHAQLAFHRFRLDFVAVASASLLFFGNMARYDIGGVNIGIMGDLAVLIDVLECLITYSMNQGIHARGCRVIGLFYQEAVANTHLFMRPEQDGANCIEPCFVAAHLSMLDESGGLSKCLLQMVIKSGRLFPKSVLVQEAVCTSLARCMKVRADFDIAQGLGAVQVILDAMHQFPRVDRIQLDGCVCINALSVVNNLLYVADKLSVVQALVIAMEEHPLHYDIQLHGFQSLENITRAAESQEMVVKAQGVKAIVHAMGRHRANTKLQEGACRAISDLATYPTPLMMKEFLFSGAIASLVYAMVAHNTNIGVQNEGMRALKLIEPKAEEVIHRLGSIRSLLPEYRWFNREDVGEGELEQPVAVDDVGTYCIPGSGCLEEMDAMEDLRPLSMMRKPGYLALQTFASEHDVGILVNHLTDEVSDAVLTALALIASHGEKFAQMVVTAGALEPVLRMASIANSGNIYASGDNAEDRELPKRTAAVTVLQVLCQYQSFAEEVQKSGDKLVPALCIAARHPSYVSLRRASLGTLANLCCFQSCKSVAEVVIKTKCIQDSLLDHETSVRTNAAFVAYWIFKHSSSAEKKSLFQKEWLFDVSTMLQSFCIMDRTPVKARRPAPASVSKGAFMACMAIREMLSDASIESVSESLDEVRHALRSVLRRSTTMAPYVAAAAVSAILGWGLCGEASLQSVIQLIRPILGLYVFVPKESDLSVQCKKCMKRLAQQLHDFSHLQIFFRFRSSNIKRRIVTCPENILKYAAQQALKLAQEDSSKVPEGLWTLFEDRRPRQKDGNKHAMELKDALRSLSALRRQSSKT